MYSIWHEILKNCVGFKKLRREPPVGGSQRSPKPPIVGRGFLPSATATSRLRRLQFLELEGSSR